MAAGASFVAGGARLQFFRLVSETQVTCCGGAHFRREAELTCG